MNFVLFLIIWYLLGVLVSFCLVLFVNSRKNYREVHVHFDCLVIILFSWITVVVQLGSIGYVIIPSIVTKFLKAKSTLRFKKWFESKQVH